jgi:hypothetical protein
VIPCGCHAMPASQHQLPLLMHHLVIHLAHGPWGPATSINRLGWAGLGWVREPNGVKQLCGVRVWVCRSEPLIDGGVVGFPSAALFAVRAADGSVEHEAQLGNGPPPSPRRQRGWSPDAVAVGCAENCGVVPDIEIDVPPQPSQQQDGAEPADAQLRRAVRPSLLPQAPTPPTRLQCGVPSKSWRWPTCICAALSMAT